jgi:hypothetical protein
MSFENFSPLPLKYGKTELKKGSLHDTYKTITQYLED